MKKIIKILKKYLPDILFLIGVWVLSCSLLKPSPFSISIGSRYEEKILAIMLIAVAFVIVIRRLFINKNKE